MKLFFEYLRSLSAPIIAFFVFFTVFALSFVLFRLPIEAVLYPTGVCALLAFTALAFGFSFYRKKHTALEKLKNNPAIMAENLPTARTLTEKDYTEIIEGLIAKKTDLISGAAEQYNDMVDYYTMWAHQIKTPIASMRLTLQNGDGAVFRKLSSELFRIEQYVEMVLAFLRLKSDMSDYVFKSCDVDAIIRESIKRFRGEFIDRKISLSYAPLNMSVVTDEKWLCFVIEQLLSNALKYTKEGGVKIYGENSRLVIEDSGIGIAPEDLPRVFQKGYTGQNGRSDKRASGLGLYLVKAVCDNLHIEISVSSALGVGTAVSLNLEQYSEKHE